MKDKDKKILLVMPKHREWNKYFPFGIATIFVFLKEKGYRVKLIDLDYNWIDLKDAIPESELKDYDIVGIGGLISAYKRVRQELVPYLKNKAPQAKIIIGGYLGTSIPELLLKNGLCDAAVIGDGEETFLELLEKIDQDKESWKSIKGLAFRQGAQYINTGPRILNNLNDTYVPFHKYFDFRTQYLINESGKGKKIQSYPMVIIRGCPFSCNFCFNSVRYKVRERAPEKIVEEIEYVYHQFGYRNFNLMAENLLSRPAWATRFCQLLKEKKLKIKWDGSGHARTINDEILKLVKRNGCYKIGIGFESFSQKILDNMNKQTTVDDYRRIIKLLRKNKLEFTGTIIFGYFGENDQTIKENLNFLKENLLWGDYFWIQAYPLTTLYKQCLEKGLIPDEDQYLQKLGDASEFVINLTDYSDEELKQKKQYLEQESHKIFKPSFGLFFRYLGAYGPQETLRRGLGYLLKTARL